MNITQNKIKSCTDIGDTVYVICGGVYKPAVVKSIGIDAIETDLDTLFYDEIGEIWCLCESTAKNITRKSHKNVL